MLKDVYQSKSINILITSRQEHDISSILKSIVNFKIPIQNENVYGNIKLYIQSYFKNDPDFNK